MRGLEFNVLSPHLLASGGDDGDLYIWDISTPSSVSHYPSLRVRVSLSICTISLLQSLFPLGFKALLSDFSLAPSSGWGPGGIKLCVLESEGA